MPRKRILAFVTNDYITFNEEDTVGYALKKWKKLVYPAKISHISYVLDEHLKLKGTIDLRELFLESPEKQLKKVMNKEFAYVNKEASLLYTSSVVIENRLSEIPVLDNDSRLMGIMITEDLINLIKWKDSKTIFQMVGIIAGEEHVSLKLKDLLKLIWARFPWLLISAVIGIFVLGSIIKNYENAITIFPAIAFFIPVLMALGGNISSQTSTIFVRLLHHRDPVVMRNISRLFLRDLMIGNMMGLILGVLIFGSSMVLYTEPTFNIALFVSMIVIANVSVIIGFLIPYLVSFTKIDPAIFSGPFVLITQDICALLIYFGVIYAIFL